MVRVVHVAALVCSVLVLGACTDMDALGSTVPADAADPLGEPVAAERGDVSWEFVLRAGGAQVSVFPDGLEVPDGLRGQQLLRLSAVDPSVVTFTDRPKRLAGELRVDELLALWHVGAFGQDPPNAAVVLAGDVVSVELLGARYEPASATILFVVDRLSTVDGAAAPLLPEGDLGAVTLFVDGAGALDGQVTDQVPTANVIALGQAPAVAMSSLYQTVAASTGVAFQNATSPTSDGALGAQGTTNQQVAELYSVDTVAPAGAGPTPRISAPAAELPAIESLVQQLDANVGGSAPSG